MRGRFTEWPWQCVAIWCFGLAACQSHESAAREQFAEKYSCPAERVSVSPRKDLLWNEVSPLHDAGAPPEEVRKDPGRLAKWNADRQKEKDVWAKRAEDWEVFQVEGCDHEMLAGCKRPAKSSDGKPNCHFEELPKK